MPKSPKAKSKNPLRKRPSTEEGRRTIEFGEKLIGDLEERKTADGFQHFAEFIRHIVRQYLAA